MPPEVADGLARLVAVAAIGGAVAVIGLIGLARATPARSVWAAWAGGATLLVFCWAFLTHTLGAEGPVALFIAVAAIAIPTAPLVWVAIWRAEREPRSSLLVDWLIGAVALAVATPLGLFVAMIPDAFRFFLSQ